MKAKKIILLVFYLSFLALVYFHLFNRFFVYNNKVISQPLKINVDKSVYYISFNNRYFYYDIFDDITFISDIEYPKFIKVEFSNDEELRKKETDFIKKIFWIPQIDSINFPKKEIFCYNNIILNYYNLEDITIYLKGYNVNFFQDLNGGEYVLMGQSIFNVHDRGF
ncbi:MAG: hypothetical protein WBH84_04895 [Defluviitoga tunisiensis]|jgi:hypothetical protein|uniref:Uncharacterized protein n=1 Tax=Defluviitoga tunisiensis TaxID=1006576 RepID=A0A0C7P0L5_DEFTU|nr:hypothetical protein DTL3_1811 [Defluviitoga tunisiensis]